MIPCNETVFLLMSVAYFLLKYTKLVDFRSENIFLVNRLGKTEDKLSLSYLIVGV